MTTPSLSVILPTYNEAGWLPETIRAIDDDLTRAEWFNAEIVIVNDGSTDDTLDVLGKLSTVAPLRVVTQENSGRFVARRTGLSSATGQFALMIDSRVRPVPGSLSFLAAQFRDHPERSVWNGDVDLNDAHKPYAAFWLCITRLAWRRYFRRRELTSFGIEEFDYYPKGTTFFVAPRATLLDLCEGFMSNFEDLSLANDDTLLIKPLSATERIFISPEFRCVYFSRDSARKFLKHTYHRGTVFVDAYLHRGSRYLPLFLCAGVVGLTFLLLAWLHPLIAVGALAAGVFLLMALFRYAGIEWRVIFGFLQALPLFVPAYSLGIFRGIRMMLRARNSRTNQK